MRMNANTTNTNNGFTLLLAVLVGSIILAISLSIFGIIIREISLSTSARESRLAFFAADSGVECALYWDFTQSAFDPAIQAAGGVDITCNNTAINTNDVFDGTGIYTFQVPFDDGSCAYEVIVEKVCESTGQVGLCPPAEPDQTITTTIASRGHNTCSGDFRIERGLLITY